MYGSFAVPVFRSLSAFPAQLSSLQWRFAACVRMHPSLALRNWLARAENKETTLLLGLLLYFTASFASGICMCGVVARLLGTPWWCGDDLTTSNMTSSDLCLTGLTP